MAQIPLENTYHPGVSVIFPCLNERETIERAVTQAIRALAENGIEGEVVVADNGSTDGSPFLAHRAGARVVAVAQRGYGAALHAGIRAARFRWVVFADCDLSYPLEEIPKLIMPLASNDADLVLGSRLRGAIDRGAMPFLNRHLGTPVLSFLIRTLYKIPTSDCNSGMRALDRTLYDSLQLASPGMEYASEMLIRVGQKKWRYFETPISFRKDARNRAPHLRPWRDGWRHLRFILGNASFRWLVTAPSIASFALLAYTFLLSFQPLLTGKPTFHFHTAFALIAVALPLLLCSLSSLLVKAVLHSSGLLPHLGVQRISLWCERGMPVVLSLGFFGLVGLEAVSMIYHWAQTGWGPLFEMGSVIRIMIYTLLAAVFFTLDMNMSILRLVKYERLEDSPLKSDIPRVSIAERSTPLSA